METLSLLLDTEVNSIVPQPKLGSETPSGTPRLRQPDRHQVTLEPVCLEDRLPASHRARMVWGVVEGMDLSQFYDVIAARGSEPGRAATAPQLLVALWLYATIDNVGSARRLAQLCEEHDAYRWLCGGVSVNHHTLSDFRVGNEQALDDLMTQVIAALVDQGAVTVERISQDSLRTRASAGSSSFRREETLRRLLDEARAHVARVKQEAETESGGSARCRAARKRAARERQERVEAALAVLPELQKIKEHQTGKPSKDQPARVSTTDAEARRMKVGSGAVLPAYNVQWVTDTASRAIVAVEVVNTGSDQSQSEPLRQQAERRAGRSVKAHLFDGGYVKKDLIDQAATDGVTIYAPLPKNRDGEPCVQGQRDRPGVAAWRARMTTPEAKDIYKQRAATSETVNAEIKTYRGLSAFVVRGLKKVRCVALWAALAYNLVHWGDKLMS